MSYTEETLMTIVRDLLGKIQMIRCTPEHFKEYLLRIHDIRNKFASFHEEITPKTALSDLYFCIGRMRFYADQMLFLYLELSERANRRDGLTSSQWPVRTTWKVELIKEPELDDEYKTVKLGEMSSVFNRPRQGFVSHINDWIAIRLDNIESLNIIAGDGLLTLKWTVAAEPVLQEVQLEQLEEFLKQTESYLKTFCKVDTSRLAEILLDIVKEIDANKKKISSLEVELQNISEQLNTILEKLGVIDGQLVSMQYVDQ